MELEWAAKMEMQSGARSGTVSNVGIRWQVQGESRSIDIIIFYGS